MITRRIIFLIFAISLVFGGFGQISIVSCEPSSIQEQALAYIKQVLPIDTARYTIIFENYRENNISTINGRLMQCITYKLTSNENVLVVDCTFRNGVQCALEMRVQSGSLISDYSEKANLIEAAKRILQAHETQTKSNLTQLANLLDIVNPNNNQSSVSLGENTLTIRQTRVPIGLKQIEGTIHVDSSDTKERTSFIWENSVNSSIPSLIITFQNGVFYSLNDERTLIEAKNQNAVSSNAFSSTPIIDTNSLSAVTIIMVILVAIAFTICPIILKKADKSVGILA